MIKMPVIAESPPLLFGTGNGEVPPVSPVPPTVIISAACNLHSLLTNHKMFIEHVDQLGSCFAREDMEEFSDTEFEFHKELATVDKYITRNGESYCSMQALEDLSEKLKRFKD